jgi:hypothetical protein
MTKTETMANSFLTLVKALPRGQRNAIVARIASDEEFAEDIMDLATFAAREKEPSRPLREYMTAKQQRLNRRTIRLQSC